ncbi:feather keratin 1-like [Geothlypis trichas]
MAELMETKAQPVASGRIFCLGGGSGGKLLPLCSGCGPGAGQEQYKSSTFSSLSHPLLQLHLVGNKVHVQPQAMSCYTRCQPCQPCGPTPLGSSCNEPCVRQCQDSTVAIQPSPVVVTLPGPILSSFPQNTAVGSSTSAAVGSILSSQGVPISSGGFGLSGLGSGLCGLPC